jgi:hypothetical protein
VACSIFWMMTALMSEQSGLSMRMLWHPEYPHMKLRVFQFDRIMAAQLPKLHAHFKNIRLSPDVLVSTQAPPPFTDMKWPWSLQ